MLGIDLFLVPLNINGLRTLTEWRGLPRAPALLLIPARTGLGLFMSAFRPLMSEALSPRIRHDVSRIGFQTLPLRSFGSDGRINSEEAKL